MCCGVRLIVQCVIGLCRFSVIFHWAGESWEACRVRISVGMYLRLRLERNQGWRQLRVQTMHTPLLSNIPTIYHQNPIYPATISTMVDNSMEISPRITFSWAASPLTSFHASRTCIRRLPKTENLWVRLNFVWAYVMKGPGDESGYNCPWIVDRVWEMNVEGLDYLIQIWSLMIDDMLYEMHLMLGPPSWWPDNWLQVRRNMIDTSHFLKVDLGSMED